MDISYVKQITAGGGASPEGLAQALDDFLAGETGIALFDLAFFAPDSSRHTGGTLIVTYRKPSTTSYRAAIFSDGPAGSAEAQMNAFLQLNDRRRPVRLIDMTPDRSRQEDSTTVMMLYTDSLVPSGVPGASRAVILRATGLIATGADGTAQLVTADGADAPTPPVAVTNRGMYAWQAGLDAYAYPEPTSGATFQAFPVGCNA